jgi:hypothetical protein
MVCPRCVHQLLWHNDFVCEEVMVDGCAEGTVSYYSCKGCKLDVQIKTECECDKDES